MRGKPAEEERKRGGEEERREEASVLPQSGDCWNADRSICHGLLSHTHLLPKGPALFLFHPHGLSISLYLFLSLLLSPSVSGSIE